MGHCMFIQGDPRTSPPAAPMPPPKPGGQHVADGGINRVERRAAPPAPTPEGERPTVHQAPGCTPRGPQPRHPKVETLNDAPRPLAPPHRVRPSAGRSSARNLKITNLEAPLPP